MALCFGFSVPDHGTSRKVYILPLRVSIIEPVHESFRKLAFGMLTTALKWRNTYGVDALMASGEIGLVKTVPKFTEQFQLGRSYYHGFDRKKRPVFYAHARMHDPKAQPALTVEKFTVYSMEIGRVLMAHVGQTCLVFDLTGFGLKNMDWGFVLFLAKSFEAYYPVRIAINNSYINTNIVGVGNSRARHSAWRTVDILRHMEGSFAITRPSGSIENHIHKGLYRTMRAY